MLTNYVCIILVTLAQVNSLGLPITGIAYVCGITYYACQVQKRRGAQMDSKALEQELRDNWLSRGEAARLAGVSPEWIRSLWVTGGIESIDTPAGRLYNRADVERVAREREAKKVAA